MGLNVTIYGDEFETTCHCCGGITTEKEEIFSGGTTHNLINMASEAGIYEALWRPHRLNKGYRSDMTEQEENSLSNSLDIRCKDIEKQLEKGLDKLKRDPDYFKKFDSPNGWGLYKHFVPFVEEYLEAIKENPDRIISICR